MLGIGTSGNPIITGGDFNFFIYLDKTLLTISLEIEPELIPVSKQMILFVFFTDLNIKFKFKGFIIFRSMISNSIPKWDFNISDALIASIVK